MEKIKIIAGDIPAGDCVISCHQELKVVIIVPLGGKDSYTLHLKRVEQLTAEKIKTLSGTAGWGVVGAALLGPLGAIGGMLLGGNKTEMSFLCETEEGVSFLGVSNVKVYQELVALVLSSTLTGETALDK